ncbi:MAG: hypothetical protein V2A67_08020 [Bacteroidota bacterium]
MILKGRKGEEIIDCYPELGYISTAEAKSLFGVTLLTLERYRTFYHLPYFKAGRRVFYRIEDIHQLINQAEEEGTPLKYRRINHD